MKRHIGKERFVYSPIGSRVQPQCRVPLAGYALLLGFVSAASPNLNAASNSIARIWNERALASIRVDTPHPPVQARNLFSLSTCMYDAWAAYDTNGAVGYIYHGKHTAGDVAAARREAISYAAYRMLKERYVFSRSASNTLWSLDEAMAGLGYATNNTSLDTSTPAGVGNKVYAAISAWFINDGCYQTNAYQDLAPAQGGYAPINQAMATGQPGVGPGLVDVNRW